jgi:hypothetical protein
MIPDDVSEKAQKVAQDEHMSLDEFTTLALIQRLSTKIPDPYLEERARRGNPQRFREILAQVPHVEPEEHDRLD